MMALSCLGQYLSLTGEILPWTEAVGIFFKPSSPVQHGEDNTMVYPTRSLHF